LAGNERRRRLRKPFEGLAMRLAELQQALRGADMSAVLVAPRVLDRVIQRVGKLSTLLGEVPHRHCFVVDRPVLYRHVEQDELDLEPDRLLPASVILLARPSPNTLATHDRKSLLLEYWRRLFHASVHRAFGELLAEGQLTAAGIAERIAYLGADEFAEVRMVLGQEELLLPGADDTAVYVEFAALYLELRYFAASLVPIYFPSLADPERIDHLLGRDIDAADLFRRTRLSGAPDPVVRTDTNSDESHDYYWRLIRNAEKADRAGNIVRAAIVRTQAARVAPASLTRSTRDDAKADLRRLTDRLKAALLLTDGEADEWMEVLPALLDKADQGDNPSEAALLYDLQKVRFDHEREIYALDPVEWLLSGGKRPMKRPLPSQRLVRITKHLRAAAQRLTQARLSDEERQHLNRLLETALHRTEEWLRNCFRPVLTDALVSVGLQPANLPESTAFAKMIEEMLDRIIAVGFLTFSDLRDAISRNQVKVSDLSDPQEFVRGGPLLRLDRRLSTALDGVYRPGEFYLRWLQRVTSVLFGTAVGRWLTLFVLVPFGGAMLILDGLQYLLDNTVGRFVAGGLPLFGPLHWLMPPQVYGEKDAKQLVDAAAALERVLPVPVGSLLPDPGGAAGGPTAVLSALEALGPSLRELAVARRVRADGLVTLEIFVCLGFILLGLLHSARLRRWAAHAGLLGWWGLRGLAYDLPAWLLSRPWVKALWDSWPFHLFAALLLGPLAVSVVVCWWVGDTSWPARVSIFVAASFILNSRFGREVGEGIGQALHDFYEQLRAGLIPGLFRFIMTLFKRILDAIEYVLFTVDEWLRFRTGEGPFSMVVRAVGTVLWYPISFLIRFYLVVLIEPGFNPVKAPVSILAAKFIYPILGVSGLSENLIEPWKLRVGPVLTWGLVLPTAWLLPDAFGFLFWEFKENWRLYKANRQPTLRPVPVGPSGETVRRLLEPGFHSGTVPKLYARLRHAERDALQTGNWRAARGYWRSLALVQQSLQRLVDRELVTLLREGPAWRGQPLGVGRVTLAPKQIRIELTHGAYPAEPVWLDWSAQGNRLVASVQHPGWLAHVGAEQRQAVAAALAGLYKLAGVDVVREQVRANLPAAAKAFDFTDSYLEVWSLPGREPAALYNLDTPKGPLLPRTPEGAPAAGWPALEPTRVLYGRAPLTWQRWVARWQADGDGKAPAPLFSPAVQLLPAGDGV
jgi:hypothetical protein